MKELSSVLERAEVYKLADLEKAKKNDALRKQTDGHVFHRNGDCHRETLSGALAALCRVEG